MFEIQKEGEIMSNGYYGTVHPCETNLKIPTVVKRCKQSDDDLPSLIEPLITLSMTHPNILKCYHAYYDEITTDLVMVQERYEKDLYSVKEINPDEALHLITCILQGLRALDERCIIHGDLKPENILIKGKDAVICDFGISLIRQPVKGNLYSDDIICTEIYRAPELFDKSTVASPKVDIWSLGVMALEMCIEGCRLFHHKSTVKSINDWAVYTGQSYSIDLGEKEETKGTFNKRIKKVGEEWRKVYELGKWMTTYDPYSRPSAYDILTSGKLGKVSLKPYTMDYRCPIKPSVEDLESSRRMMRLKLRIDSVSGQLDFIFACFREHYNLNKSVDFSCVLFSVISGVELNRSNISGFSISEFRTAMEKLSFFILPPS